MLRIDVRHDVPATVRVALIGDFCAAQIDEIHSLIHEVSQSAERVALDLSAVRRVDRAAVRFLAIAGGYGAELIGCPAYVREWIRCEAVR
jgi:anti-anti-sigma regulatory factor